MITLMVVLEKCFRDEIDASWEKTEPNLTLVVRLCFDRVGRAAILGQEWTIPSKHSFRYLAWLLILASRPLGMGTNSCQWACQQT
jgi:hypothetical protein